MKPHRYRFKIIFHCFVEKVKLLRDMQERKLLYIYNDYTNDCILNCI